MRKILVPWLAKSIEELETPEGRATQKARFERWKRENEELEALRAAGKNVMDAFDGDEVRPEFLNKH